MPWRAVEVVSLRRKFVALAQKDEVTFSELCRRFGASRDVAWASGP